MSHYSGWKASGSYFSMEMPTELVKADTLMAWSVSVQDAKTGGGGAYSSSPWSNSCYFVYDTKGPAAPKVVSEGGEYPPPDPANPEDMPHGGVGEYGWFAITSGTDAVRFEYQFSGSAVVSRVGSGGRVAYLPQDPGDHRLTATAFDAAGNKSTTQYDFRVNYGRDSVGNWTFDDPIEGERVPSGFTPAGDAHVVEPEGDAAAEGSALRLDGTGDWAHSTDGSVSTAGHFAVEAWARVESLPTTPAMMVSRAGSNQLGFMLYLSSAQNRWVFGQVEFDSPGSSGARAISSAPAAVGKWTHLVGVVDAYRNTMQLYVNGVPGAEVSVPNGWSATGETLIGAARACFGSPFRVVCRVRHDAGSWLVVI